VVNMKNITVFWDVRLYSLVNIRDEPDVSTNSPSTWKMEVAASSETFVPSYHTTEGSGLLHALWSSLALTSNQLFHLGLLLMVVWMI